MKTILTRNTQTVSGKTRTLNKCSKIRRNSSDPQSKNFFRAITTTRRSLNSKRKKARHHLVWARHLHQQRMRRQQTSHTEIQAAQAIKMRKPLKKGGKHTRFRIRQHNRTKRQTVRVTSIPRFIGRALKTLSSTRRPQTQTKTARKSKGTKQKAASL